MMSYFKIYLLIPLIFTGHRLLDGGPTDRSSPPFSGWHDCGGADKVVSLTSLQMVPVPLSLSRDLLMSFEAHSSRVISNATLKMTIKRETFLGDFYIPCAYNMGSCTYDNMCSLLDLMTSEDWWGLSRDIANQIRQLLESNHVPYTCPVQPSAMSVQNFTFHMPPVPPIIAYFAGV